MKTVAPSSPQSCTHGYDTVDQCVAAAPPAGVRSTICYDTADRHSLASFGVVRRTSFSYDGNAPGPHLFRKQTNRLPTVSPAAARYTVVADANPAQVVRTEHSSQPAAPRGRLPSREAASAYELFESFCHAADSIVARHLLDSFFAHPEISAVVEGECRRLVARGAVESDAWEDIAQEALLILMTRLNVNIGRYRDDGPAPFTIWLRKISHDACVDAIRRGRSRGWRRLRVIAPEKLTMLPAAPAIDHSLASLRCVLGGMPDELHKRILDDLIEGWSIDEIAARLGVSRSAAYRLRDAARLELAKRLARD